MSKIKFIKSSKTSVPVKIEESDYDFQALVVRSERKMYMYLCGDLNHIISDLPTFDKSLINELFDKASSLTSVYGTIIADYQTVLNDYDSYIEGSL